MEEQDLQEASDEGVTVLGMRFPYDPALMHMLYIERSFIIMLSMHLSALHNAKKLNKQIYSKTM
jgi:hypothetical protein